MTVYSAKDVYKTINLVYRLQKFADIPVDRGIVYTAIVLKESGGDSAALNADDGGSRSRGWWQIQEVNHPSVTDAMAFNPLESTKYAYKISNGFALSGVTPWIGPGRKTLGDEFGTNANRFNAFYNAIGAAAQLGVFDATTDAVNNLYKDLGIPQQLQENSTEGGFDDSGDFGPLDVLGQAKDLAVDGYSAATSGVTAVGDFIGIISNPEFWKRVGLGALGLLVVLIALALYLSKNSPISQVIGAIKDE